MSCRVSSAALGLRAGGGWVVGVKIVIFFSNTDDYWNPLANNRNVVV